VKNRFLELNSYKFAFKVPEKAHVGITPGIVFGTAGEGFVRFSYANSLENIRIGMYRLEEFLSKNYSTIRLIENYK
jgi:aspartate/methionine/tyrosine aminotransferase